MNTTKLKFYDTIVDYGIDSAINAAGVQGFKIIKSHFDIKALTYSITYEIDGLGLFNIRTPASRCGYDDAIIAMIIAGCRGPGV